MQNDLDEAVEGMIRENWVTCVVLDSPFHDWYLQLEVIVVWIKIFKFKPEHDVLKKKKQKTKD